MRPLYLLLFGAASLVAQPLSFGLKGGVPLTDFIDTVGNNPSFQAITHPKRYIVGPTLELRLPWGFAIEVDALYRRLNYQIVPTTPTGVGASLATSNDWEFPVLLKYRFASRKFVRPYVAGGVAFDRLQGLASTAAGAVSAITTSNPAELKNPGTMGAVAGAGLDVHFLFLHLSPELRYTRWTSQHFNLTNVLASNQNQAEFLVGITF
jgi:Outer membrane protein beta-barrel domain